MVFISWQTGQAPVYADAPLDGLKQRGVQRRMKPASMILALMAGATPTLADAAAVSFCDAGEKVFFTCQIGKKTLSLCGSQKVDAQSGYLQYRFGVLGQVPELSYPSDFDHPRKRFRYYFDLGSAKASSFQVSFELQGNRYVVFSYSSAFDWNGHGVLVIPQGRKTVTLMCQESRVHHELYALRNAAMPVAEFEDPEPGAR